MHKGDHKNWIMHQLLLLLVLRLLVAPFGKEIHSTNVEQYFLCAFSVSCFAAHWTDGCVFLVAKSQDLIHTPLSRIYLEFRISTGARVSGLTSCLTTCLQLHNSQEFMFSFLNPIKNAIGLGWAALFSKDAFKFSLTTMTTLRATAEAARHATITISPAPFRPCPLSGTCLRVCHVTSYYSHKRWPNMRRVREREWYTYTVRGKEGKRDNVWRGVSLSATMTWFIK